MANSDRIENLEGADAGESALQKRWRNFCRLMVRVFYRRREAHGLERIPARGPVLLCANHPNALADALIIQAFCPRIVHPLARSGLFDQTWMRPILKILQAVPIYRRQDSGVDTGRNAESFAQCFELFARGEVLLIFPEGQTHSESRLRTIKTGAARLARGSIEATGVAPTVLPIGLTFGDKGRFRSSVFVEVGKPIDLAPLSDEQSENTVRRLTGAIENGMKEVTLNAESRDEIDFSRRLERFIALRHGRYRRGSLEQRSRALKKLIQSQHILREREPGQLDELNRRLNRFERLCHHFGIRDYQLTVRYSTAVVTRFVLRSLFMVMFVLPVALWGVINSVVPFVVTQQSVRRFSLGDFEYDTVRMLTALSIFVVAWTGQTMLVFWFFGGVPALLYFAALLPATAAAILMRREKDRIIENLRGFFSFIRNRKIRDYLLSQRTELEKHLAQITRSIKRTN